MLNQALFSSKDAPVLNIRSKPHRKAHLKKKRLGGESGGGRGSDLRGEWVRRGFHKVYIPTPPPSALRQAVGDNVTGQQ